VTQVRAPAPEDACTTRLTPDERHSRMSLRPSLRRFLTGLALLAGLMALTPAPSGAATRPAGPQPGCGTWVLQQVSDKSALERQAPAIDAALANSGVAGLSLRVPWTAIDTDFGVLNRAAQLAKARGKQLSVRFMAGASTPARVFNEGAYYYTAGTKKMPKPFSNTGVAGNPVFESNFKVVVTKLAAWSRANGVKLLHLPWYGYKWAEIYNGTDLQATKGYTYDAWLKGHLKLLDMGLAVSGNDLTVEFALSGHWGGNATAAKTIAERIVSSAGAWSRRAMVQGNGLGQWNAPATRSNVYHAKQMVDGGDYDWASIYQTLRANDEAYVEVYLSSFAGPRKASLISQAQAFKTQRC
jgi:hypothetical protein